MNDSIWNGFAFVRSWPILCRLKCPWRTFLDEFGFSCEWQRRRKMDDSPVGASKLAVLPELWETADLHACAHACSQITSCGHTDHLQSAINKFYKIENRCKMEPQFFSESMVGKLLKWQSTKQQLNATTLDYVIWTTVFVFVFRNDERSQWTRSCRWEC